MQGVGRTHAHTLSLSHSQSTKTMLQLMLLQLAAHERRLVSAAAPHAIDRGSSMRSPAARLLSRVCLAAAAQLLLQRLLQRAAAMRLQACSAKGIATQLLIIKLKVQLPLQRLRHARDEWEHTGCFSAA